MSQPPWQQPGQPQQSSSDPYGQPTQPVQPAPGQPPVYGQSPYAAYPSAPYGAAPGMYGAPQHPQRHPGTNGFAIAGFVLGLIGGCVLGLIFSIIGLKQTKSRPQDGRGLAIAGLILSILWMLAAAAIIAAAIASNADRGEDGAINEKGSISSSDIRVGDCINEPKMETGETTEVQRVEAVPCDQPHDAEAYARFTIEGATFPGQDAVISKTEQGCATRAKEFIGRDPADSELSVLYFFPTSSSWRLGDRAAVCMVGEGHGKTTVETLRGANR